MMKLKEKLVVMLIRLRNALTLLLIRIPLIIPLALFVVVWNGLLALFFRALGSREDARDFMNATGRSFKAMWEGIKSQFSAKEILDDYYDAKRYLNEEEP